MVERGVKLDQVFHALAHAGRRDMLTRLAESDLTVSELAEPLAMSLAAASKHVQVLERAGLLRRTVVGRRHICSLVGAPLAAAAAVLNFTHRREQPFDAHETQRRAAWDETAERVTLRLRRTIFAT